MVYRIALPNGVSNDVSNGITNAVPNDVLKGTLNGVPNSATGGIDFLYIRA